MERCAYCQNRSSSKIPAETTSACQKNRSGSCTACQQLLHIERKIEAAYQALVMLVNERDQLASIVNDYHDPFEHRLPVEIISRVFLNCRPSQPSLDVFDSPFDEKQHIKTLLEFGHINRTWRNISHNTPELWTIYDTTLTESNSINSMSFASEWLRRSGGLPLYVRLSWDDFDGELMSEVVSHSVQRIVKSVASHAQRLKVLVIRLPSEMLSNLSNSLTLKKLDCLEHLAVFLDQGDPNLDFKLNASPRVLTIENGWLLFLHINWSRLTKFLSRDTINLDECVHLFRHAPNLTHCDISEFTPASPLRRPMNHYSLEQLVVRSGGMGFWESFAFPSLNTVHVLGNDGSWHGLRDLVRRSGCKITQLVIREMEQSNGDEIIDVFRATTELKQLSVSGNILGGPLLSGMGASASSVDGFLCKLELISLEISEPPFDWAGLMVLLITMVSRPKKSLREVKVRLSGRTPNRYGTLIDKTMLKHVMDASQAFDLRFIDFEGLDLLGKLREYHGL